ncbi:hypothetical protein [Candidatus Phytoplasma australiense]|uniref:hypothetical protein n=1 Tax=Phytoplasma australiense TaxID=59748 RepID=UPI00130DC684|nr:hypothetical protein [Candidatus Phytoplasma australiense]
MKKYKHFYLHLRRLKRFDLPTGSNFLKLLISLLTSLLLSLFFYTLIFLRQNKTI